MTPAEANARIRQRHAERVAALRPPRSGVATVPATLRNGAHGHPTPPTIAKPAPTIPERREDADSAGEVLANARAFGVPGLVKREPATKENSSVDMRSPVDKREDEATAAMLDDMRALGLPGLKKRATAQPAAKSASKKEDDTLDLARRVGIPGLKRR